MTLSIKLWAASSAAVSSVMMAAQAAGHATDGMSIWLQVTIALIGGGGLVRLIERLSMRYIDGREAAERRDRDEVAELRRDILRLTNESARLASENDNLHARINALTAGAAGTHE